MGFSPTSLALPLEMALVANCCANRCLKCDVCTEAEFVSGKLPLLVVRQLGWVNKGVVVPISALNDLPANLIFGFLVEEEHQVRPCHQAASPPKTLIGFIPSPSNSYICGSTGSVIDF